MVDMGILVEMLDALGVERRGPALNAVNFVAVFQQKLGQIGAILPGDARDQCDFLLRFSSLPFRMHPLAVGTGFRTCETESRGLQLSPPAIPSRLTGRPQTGAPHWQTASLAGYGQKQVRRCIDFL